MTKNLMRTDGIVDRLVGDEETKRRLEGILAVIRGERTADDVARELDIARSQLYELRSRVLQGGLDALAPGAPGRPAAAEGQGSTGDESQSATSDLEDLSNEALFAKMRLMAASLGYQIEEPPTLRGVRAEDAPSQRSAIVERLRSEIRGIEELARELIDERDQNSEAVTDPRDGRRRQSSDRAREHEARGRLLS